MYPLPTIRGAQPALPSAVRGSARVVTDSSDYFLNWIFSPKSVLLVTVSTSCRFARTEETYQIYISFESSSPTFFVTTIKTSLKSENELKIYIFGLFQFLRGHLHSHTSGYCGFVTSRENLHRHNPQCQNTTSGAVKSFVASSLTALEHPKVCFSSGLDRN